MFWEEEGGSTNLSFSNGFTYMNILKHIFVIIYSRLYCFYYVILISNDTLKIREHLFLISIKYNSIKIERSGKYLISLFLTSSLFMFCYEEFWIICLNYFFSHLSMCWKDIGDFESSIRARGDREGSADLRLTEHAQQRLVRTGGRDADQPPTFGAPHHQGGKWNPRNPPTGSNTSARRCRCGERNAGICPYIYISHRFRTGVFFKENEVRRGIGDCFVERDWGLEGVEGDSDPWWQEASAHPPGGLCGGTPYYGGQGFLGTPYTQNRHGER